LEGRLYRGSGRNACLGWERRLELRRLDGVAAVMNAGRDGSDRNGCGFLGGFGLFLMNRVGRSLAGS
jgi:hypothetical protein